MKSLALFTACLLAVATRTVVAHAASDRGTTASATSCRYSVAFSAPASCPDVSALERRLGPDYRVERGTMQSCDDCVRGITIEQTSAPEGYRMELAGLESTAVDRSECEDLVDLAVHAIEASDLPAPDCGQAMGRVGMSVTPFVNIANADPMVLMSLRGTVPLGFWQVTPFGTFLLPTRTPNQANASGAGALSFRGFGAGLETCHATHPRVQLCAAGQWRRLNAEAVSGNWTSAVAADIWTLGAGVAWALHLSESIRFEVEPLVMAVLGKRGLTDAATGVQLYSHAGIEALLRVGFSWEFGARDTPVGTEALRAAATPVLPALRAASSNDTRWF